MGLWFLYILFVVGILHAGVLLTTIMFLPPEIYYIFYIIVEAMLIALIVWHAWKRPKQES